MTSSHSVCAIVPAAGVGKRFGATQPKQYLTINGKSILEHTLERLIAHPAIEHVYVAINPSDPFYSSLPIAQAPWLTRVDGGATRAESVASALSNALQFTWSVVHDAARPCLTRGDLDALLQHLSSGYEDAAILATPVRDTMKRGVFDGSVHVAETVSRENLWHALTPQLCQTKKLMSCLAQAINHGATITDEASAMEYCNEPVRLIRGNISNIKVTHPEDLALATFYLQQQEMTQR